MSELDQLRAECDELRRRLAAAETATREAFQGTARLTRMLTVLAEPVDLPRLLDLALSCLSELFDAEVTCLLVPHGDDRLEPVAVCGLGDEVDPASLSWTGGAAAEALAGGRIVRADHGSSAGLPPALAAAGVRTAVLVPTRTDEGAHGVLGLFRCRDEPFSSGDLPILTAIAHRTATAVEQAQRAQQIEGLSRLSAMLGEHLEVERVLSSRVQPVAALLDADACLIALAGEEGGPTALRSHWGLSGGELERWRFAVRGAEEWEATARERATDRAVVTALVTGSGDPIGAVAALRAAARPFRQRDAHVLRLCAVGMGRSILNAQLHEAIRRTAHHDELTGLPNRRLLYGLVDEALDRFEQAGERPTLVFVDLDGFKEVNDTLGHHAGDTVLVEVSRRLRSCVRADDVLGRLGGDEFVIVLRGRDCAGSVDRVCKRISDALRAPFMVGGGSFVLSASFGVVTPAQPGVSCESLLRQADAAMYRMKAERPLRAPLFVNAA